MKKIRGEIGRVMRRLPRLDCGHCSYQTCKELAGKIVAGKAKVDDCWILRQKQNVLVKIENEKIPLHPFVQNIIRNTILAMLRSLKHTNLKGDEYLLINVRKKIKTN